MTAWRGVMTHDCMAGGPRPMTLTVFRVSQKQMAQDFGINGVHVSNWLRDSEAQRAAPGTVAAGKRVVKWYEANKVT